MLHCNNNVPFSVKRNLCGPWPARMLQNRLRDERGQLQVFQRNANLQRAQSHFFQRLCANESALVAQISASDRNVKLARNRVDRKHGWRDSSGILSDRPHKRTICVRLCHKLLIGCGTACQEEQNHVWIDKVRLQCRAAISRDSVDIGTCCNEHTRTGHLGELERWRASRRLFSIDVRARLNQHTQDIQTARLSSHDEGRLAHAIARFEVDTGSNQTTHDLQPLLLGSCTASARLCSFIVAAMYAFHSSVQCIATERIRRVDACAATQQQIDQWTVLAINGATQWWRATSITHSQRRTGVKQHRDNVRTSRNRMAEKTVLVVATRIDTFVAQQTR